MGWGPDGDEVCLVCWCRQRVGLRDHLATWLGLLWFRLGMDGRAGAALKMCDDAQEC